MDRLYPATPVALLSAFLLSSCGGATATAGRDITAYTTAVEANRAPANPADVRFLTGMIPHHAQAVLFAGWAESHGASRAIVAFCERVVVGQRDEIATMSSWLRDHGQPVPDLDPETMQLRMDMAMPGMDHHMHMPGMLTKAQLDELDAARGPDFDRLFLTYMIAHHQGALVMVDELFASYGGANDDVIYKIASDIYADQSTEIERMERMLEAMDEPSLKSHVPTLPTLPSDSLPDRP